jgi:hypothetical protein
MYVYIEKEQREKSLRDSKSSDGTDAYYLAAIRSKMNTPVLKDDHHHSTIQSNVLMNTLAMNNLSMNNLAMSNSISNQAMLSDDPSSTGLGSKPTTGTSLSTSRVDTTRDSLSGSSKARKTIALPTMRGSGSTTTVQTAKSSVKK